MNEKPRNIARRFLPKQSIKKLMDRFVAKSARDGRSLVMTTFLSEKATNLVV